MKMLAKPLTAIALVTSASVAVAEGLYDQDVSIPIEFKFHIDDQLAEQDVFLEREPGSGKVWRATAADRDMDAPLYTTREEVHHNPFDAATNGPHDKGEALGLTLGEWFEAEGSGTYTCSNGEATLKVDFQGLAPDGVYTLWHYFMAWPPTDPFIGTYDLPVGERDGSQSAFLADADGNGTYEQTFKPCLQLTGEHLAAGVAVALHSDGETHGTLAGAFGKNAHVQLYTFLPVRAGM